MAENSGISMITPQLRCSIRVKNQICIRYSNLANENLDLWMLFSLEPLFRAEISQLAMFDDSESVSFCCVGEVAGLACRSMG
jgi:hypothetical protein